MKTEQIQVLVRRKRLNQQSEEIVLERNKVDLFAHERRKQLGDKVKLKGE